MPRPKLGAVVMAAGEGRRFGSAKQLLEVDGVPLVCRAIAAALNARVSRVAVVTGAHAHAVADAVRAWVAHCEGSADVALAHNPDWHTGMRSSLRVGMRALTAMDSPDACFILLADQPNLTASVLTGFAARLQGTSTDAVALAYPSGPGVPALFSRKLYPRLLGEDVAYPDEGAKAILRDEGVRTELIDDPAQRVDVDTREAWRLWLADKSQI